MDCHLVSLPTVVLTRIDKNTLDSIQSVNSTKTKNAPINKPVKKKNIVSPLKSIVKKIASKKIEGRPRGRPRKDINSKPKLQKQLKQSVKTKPTIKTSKASSKSRIVSKKLNISPTKNILKKTMLQKKSKIVIPQAKKPKLVKKQIDKQTPTKISKPTSTKIGKPTPTKIGKPTPTNISKATPTTISKPTTTTISKPMPTTISKPIPTTISKPTPPKVSKTKPVAKKEIPVTIPANTDSSEDEFLYDELINEFESTFGKTSLMETEKTTNITLKPSTGNKPPTIVKGGIIKIDNLPADLKTIASPGQQLPKITKESSSQKRPKLTQTDSPVPNKKSSPWPISISQPSIEPIKNSPKKNAVSKINVPKVVKPKLNAKPQEKPSNKNVKSVSNTSILNNNLTVDRNSISVIPGKPKIGPKLAIKSNLVQSTNEDDDMSDEYTEEETLENIDYNLDSNIVNEKSVINNTNTNSVSELNATKEKSNLVSNGIKDDEDPHLDLLRILTDESDDCPPNNLDNSTTNAKEVKLPSNSDVVENQSIKAISSPKEPPLTVDCDTDKEPKVRTIYDLMNEVSLQRPSWNLHIIPETNAFCIAQVTKGRLGLPTLKKCIELDPEDYNAKVYIHQYHIRRFDGMYDSEESILALIEEIDSIKA